jgi:hypothetical protein
MVSHMILYMHTKHRNEINFMLKLAEIPGVARVAHRSGLDVVGAAIPIRSAAKLYKERKRTQAIRVVRERKY